MKSKTMKRLLAVTMAGVMTLGSSVVAFADDGVTGTGVVEYDNSEAVAYDVVEVPTITASTYNFTLDPTGQLNAFDPTSYDEGSVYFASTGTRASVEGNTGVTLYTQSKTAVTASSGAWSGVAKTIEEGAITAVNGGFFVWVPDTADETYTAGKPGKFVELTASNITNWFDIKDEEAKTISLRGDYKSGANVCDGNVYQNTYTAATNNKITDSDTDPLSNYVTITNGEPSAFPNLYKDNEGTVATADDVKYTPAEVVNQGRTDAVTVINKSTNAKTVTATITMNNTTGITFNSSATYAEDDNKASMYVTATNGTTANALVASTDGSKATATYTVDLAAPTISEITYMATGTNSATGGHNYARYEANGTVYGSDSFYITATANNNASAKDAWNAWAKTVTATTRPNINIVYTVTTKVDGPSIASGATAIATPGEDGATYSVNLVNGTASNIVFNLPTGNTISKVYANGNPSNLTTENDGIVTFSGNTVTLKGDSGWASASAGTVKYIKVVVSTGESTSKDFVIKVVCNPE